MGRQTPVDDPVAAVATGSGKRALDRLITDEPNPHALPALIALLERPPVDPKTLAWMLAWAGRLALGSVPTRKTDRPADLRAAITQRYSQLSRDLDHAEPRVRIAATLPLAACRNHAVEVQGLFAERAARLDCYDDLGAMLRIASAVLARDANVPSLIPAVEGRAGRSFATYHADAIARQLDGRGAAVVDLIHARRFGERSFSKLPWFPREYPTILRGLIAERPRAEREGHALELVAAGPIETSAVELVFAHREMLPRRDRAERLRSMTLLRGDDLTPVQRTVMAAPSYYPDRGLVGSIRWPAFRVPITAFGRSIVLGTCTTGSLASIVQTARGSTPMYVALLDVLAEAMLDKRPAAKQRAAIDALLAGYSSEQRSELDRAARACSELVDAGAYSELTTGGIPWP